MPDAETNLRVLIVEDSDNDAALLLRELRKSGFATNSERVESTAAMRAALKEKQWDVIISDYVIPGFGGMQALKIAQESGLDLPFILVSGKVDEQTLVEAMKAGARDFLIKGHLGRLSTAVKHELADAAVRRGMRQAEIEWRMAFDAVRDAIFLHDEEYRIVRANRAYAALAHMAVQDVIGKRYWEVFPKLDGPLPGCRSIMVDGRGSCTAEEFASPPGAAYSSRSFPILDDRQRYLYSLHVLQNISEKKRAEDEIKRYVTQLENAFMQSVTVATTICEMRDPYTVGHERRVAELSVAIGAELGFDTRRLEGLRVAGFLHDVGKITVPAEILVKPTKLSPTEFELIKGHAQASYDVLKTVTFPWAVAEIAYQHHERLDGSGYPRRLKGDAILLEARILAVADTVEAMHSHRPYRAGLGIDKALGEIKRGRGSAYDPAVVDACLNVFAEKRFAFSA